MSQIRFQGENLNVYYEFDKETAPLGAGGMGCIYQGYRFDLNYNIQSLVAIKCIKPELTSNQSIIQRAQREASVQIDHPNLVRMYGFFSGLEYSQYSGSYVPSYYIAMERLLGINLDEVLFKGICTDKTGLEVPIARELSDQYANNREIAVAGIMKEVLKGISALHNAGYIHRDIDPSNVMLTQDGKVKVVDFGISKPLNAYSYGAGLTQAGQFLGKIAYAAPELIIGDVNSQGPATDIYALGVMMFQLITGYFPVSGSDQEVMNAHLGGDLPVKDIANKDLCRVVEKATRKNIGDRFTSVDEMLSALESVDFSKKESKSARKEIREKTKIERKPLNIIVPDWAMIASAAFGILTGIGLSFIQIL